MDTKTKAYKKKSKLSAIAHDNKGIEDRALLLILLSVLLLIVTTIIIGAISGVGKTVDKAVNVSNDVIDAYGETLKENAKGGNSTK
jgi:hypothetical protein